MANNNRPTDHERRIQTWDLAKKYIKGYDTALDCGAHIGEYTEIFAKEFTKVIAVEPNPTFQTKWYDNCGQLENVELITKALGHCEGKMFRDNPLAQVLQVSEEGDMSMVTLDSLDIDNLSFIKIDVDGSEARLLEGAIQTIKKSNPVIQIEIKDKKRPEVKKKVLQLLSELKYVPKERRGSDWIYVNI
jgi:FkbM family methyltransferase|tara:strand:- start:309 stop:875 length:567 start_codon:yes stop_codon:yes gene_type:complete